MQLTSREQALLTVALDGYITCKAKVAGFWDGATEEMWQELYDIVICADIDDVGEEYDPSLDYDSEELEWDVGLINAFALDMADAEDNDDKRDCVEAYVECMGDELAWQLYHALNNRFDAEFERQAEEMQSEWLREQSAQLDIEDAIRGVNSFHDVNVDVATQSDAAA